MSLFTEGSSISKTEIDNTTIAANEIVKWQYEYKKDLKKHEKKTANYPLIIMLSVMIVLFIILIIERILIL